MIAVEVVVAIAIGEEAVVADAVEAVRQRVKKKAADELGGVERHHFGDAFLAVILPGEADLAGFKREQPAVGNGDTMRVTAEIGERLARAAEWLGIDYPIDAAQFGETRFESIGIGEAGERTGEAQPADVMSFLQVAQEQPSKQSRKNSHREEESGAAGDPARAIERGAATGHDAMDMRVMRESLAPGVEHGGDADAGAEMAGLDSAARCNGSMKTVFGRLCQAL